jgi:probable F420-dependent oxidoreductase
MEKVHPLRPFRFGVVSAFAQTGDDWLARAREVESLGYDTLVMPDNLRFTLAPIPALSAAAAVTASLRIGTYVLANDFRNPVMLAKDLATLDLLSKGRLEIGIGAGRPDSEAENRTLGIPFGSGGERVARLAESVRMLKQLLSGQSASSTIPHYGIDKAEISPLPLQQPHPKILMAGTGRHMLQLAAREADIVAFGLSPDATADTYRERIACVREAAGNRFADIELNVNLMAVGDRVPTYVGRQLGLTAEGLAAKSSIAAVVGTPDEMRDQLLRRREELGISYILVADELMHGLAPVVERLNGR